MIEYGVGDLVNGHLELLRSLNSGAFGTVFVARDLIDDSDVAVKLLDRGQASSIEQIRREVKPLRALNHPNIVKVQGLGTTDHGIWFITMELVKGRSLRERVDESGPLDTGAVLDLGTQLLSALTVLHPDEQRINDLRGKDELTEDELYRLRDLEDDGLVHRDVKPENVLIESSGRVVLVDFGISSAAGANVATISHSPGFVPPDLHVGALHRWDPDIDRYAAAVTMRFAATGRSMDGDESADLKGLPLPLAEFFRRGCSPDRTKRFSTTTEMLDDWLDLAHEEATTAPLPAAAPFLGWDPALHQGAIKSDDDIRNLLVEIVEAEQPVICPRAYDLVRRVAPAVTTAHMNKLVFRMVSNSAGVLAQVEPLGGGQQDKTVFLAGDETTVFRELGPRRLAELPQIELRSHVAHARRALGASDEVDVDDEAMAQLVAQSLAPQGSESRIQRLVAELRQRLSS